MPSIQPSAPSGGGRGRGRRVASSLSEINVVPLVDVMLVLLIIFMVTAPMIQRGIDVTLPTATRASAIVSQRVFVTVPLSYRDDRIVYLDDEPIRADVLTERIRQRMETAAQKNVYLKGDTGLELGEVMQVTDLLKAAGVEDVAILSKLPGEQ